MSPMSRQRPTELAMSEKLGNRSLESLQEDSLTGPHKISYRPGKTWDFEGCAENAPIDIDLVMPPHRPRLQPENHRTGMFLSSEGGPVRAKVCRHALNRSFNLTISGGPDTDVTIWVPSNFSGFITVSGMHASFSLSFVELVMPNAHLNRSVPNAWSGDEITIDTGGRVSFRVWDVLSRRAEPDNAKIGKAGTGKSGSALRRKRAPGPGDVWRRMFGVGNGRGASEGNGLRPQDVQAWDWDFLIED